MKIRYISILFLIAPTVFKGYEILIHPSIFLPTSDKVQRVYGSALPAIQVGIIGELSEPLKGWVQGQFIFGESNEWKPCCHSNMKILNGSAGLLYSIDLSCAWSMYVGLGASFGDYRVRNKSWCTCERISQVEVGAIIKSGIQYKVRERFFFDLYLDYFHQSLHFAHKINGGGVIMGIGLGIPF